MKNTYSLERREDGHVWVNIQPLMADIQKNYDSLLEMNIDEFTEDDLNVLELKKLGMHSIYQFLGALAFEYRLKEERERIAMDDHLSKQIAEGTQLMEKVFH